jgi:hypothetical protein
LARKNGLPGIHFVANLFHGRPEFNPDQLGYDAVIICNPSRIRWGSRYDVALAQLIKTANNGHQPVALRSKILATADAYRRKLLGKYHKLRGHPTHMYEYADAMLFFQETDVPLKTVYPCVVPNWDNSPRSGARATILINSTPELFRRHLRSALRQAAALPAGRRIVFVKSWNEWAEGNYLEPDLKFGHQYLNVVRDEVFGLPGC